MKTSLLPFLLLVAAAIRAESAAAQVAKTCSSREAHAFDFWIGNWDIQQKILGRDGTWLSFEAKTSVAPVLDGCALIEHWEGTVQFFWEGMQAPEQMKGLSVRAYDPASDRWIIHWMDTRTPRFGGAYTGRFTGSRGEFFRQLETPQGKRLGRTFLRSHVRHSDMGVGNLE